MKFFTDHFNSHHLLRSPHRWFLALLISPLHLAEKHYQKRYHLRYSHAKKLFVFDLLLLLATVLAGAAAIFWYLYDPAVTDQVKLSVELTAHTTKLPGAPRLQSGEHVTFAMRYENQSEVELIEASLRIHLPAGFILETASPSGQYASSTGAFTLPALQPGAEGEAQVSGLFFAVPEKEEAVVAYLTYSQRGKQALEVKRAATLVTLRGSALSLELDGAESVVNGVTQTEIHTAVKTADIGSNQTLQIKLKNRGHHDLPPIIVPFPSLPAVTFSFVSSSLGKVEAGAWVLPGLKPEEAAGLTLAVSALLPETKKNLTVEVMPEIKIGAVSLTQVAAKHTFRILRPRLELTNGWADGADAARPGDTVALHVTVKNAGDVVLDDLSLSIPLPTAIIDAAQFVKLNQAAYKNGLATISPKHRPDFSRLAPDETRALTLPVSIREWPQGGTDITLSLTPRAAAKISGRKNFVVEMKAEAPGLAIGSYVILRAESRYYTVDGDQIGRGPLPPVVGKETKYWTLVRITGGTSEVKKLSFSAVVPAGVVWTGKSSVNRGADVSFDPVSRRVYWSLPELDAHDSVGVNFELSLTPVESQRGTTPALLRDITVSGEDGFIGGSVEAYAPALDSSLPGDERARVKGVKVK